jgi:ribonuclease HIII
MLNISKEEFYRRLCDILKSCGVDAADRRDFRYFIQFVARATGGECMVKIYQGKKGTHAQILNNRGDAEKTVRGAIEEMTGVLPFSAGEEAKASAPDGHAITAPLVGTDESGKGDFFGPLVVAAVYVTPEGAAELTAAGVRDCKTMTDRSVMTVASHIERSTVSAVVTLNPERYNTLYEETGNRATLMPSRAFWKRLIATLSSRTSSATRDWWRTRSLARGWR